VTPQASLPAKDIVTRISRDKSQKALRNSSDLQARRLMRIIKFLKILHREVATLPKSEERHPSAVDLNFLSASPALIEIFSPVVGLNAM
jgi:hypothetical protein